MTSNIMRGLAAALLAVAAHPALAQRPGEMTLYSAPNFTGARYTVTGQRNILNLAFQVRSVQMASGEQWQLCERRDQQRCTTYSGSVRSMMMNVQSAQPVRLPENRPWPPGASAGQSLRGMAAEFFPQPADRRGRVPSPANANAASDVANNWCRGLGWNRSAHQRLETVNGRVYLADVLCVRG